MCPQWEFNLVLIKAFFGGWDVHHQSIKDPIRGLSDIPTYDEDPTQPCRIVEAIIRGRNIFINMVGGIVCRKKVDERAQKSESRAAQMATLRDDVSRPGRLPRLQG